MSSAIHHPALESLVAPAARPNSFVAVQRTGGRLRAWLLSGTVVLAFVVGFASGAVVGTTGEQAVAEAEPQSLWR